MAPSFKKKINFFYHSPGGVKHLFPIAFPAMISNGTETLMIFTDRWLLSQLGGDYLTAGFNAHLISFLTIAIFFNIIQYSSSISSQFFGAKKYSYCIIVFYQTVFLSFLFYPLIFIIKPGLQYIFALIGTSNNILKIQNTYMDIYAFITPAIFIKLGLSSFFAALGRTKIVMKANLIALLLNVPISYFLIFGYGDFIGWKIKGAVIGTACGIFLALIYLFFKFFSLKKDSIFLFLPAFRIDKEIVLKILKFGTPSGLEIFINVLSFTIFILMFQTYNKTTAAAISIMLNYDILNIIPVIGLSIGTSVLFGHFLGAKKLTHAKQAVFSGLTLGLIWAICLSAILLFIPEPLARIFLSNANQQKEILEMAIVFIRMASIYFSLDVFLMLFSAILRSAGDTFWVMLVNVVIHFLLVLVGAVAIYYLNLSPYITWLYLCFIILVLAACFYIRYHSEKWKQFKLISHQNLK